MLQTVTKFALRRSIIISIRNFSTVRPAQEVATPPINKSSTIDHGDIARFKEKADIWWDDLGPLKSLLALNGIRIPFIRDGIINTGIISKEVANSAKPLQDIQILDVGCGGGFLSEPLARLGADVTGLDACSDLIECAKIHAQSDPEIANRICYIFDTIEKHCEMNRGKYDAVVASEIIEHVAHQDLFLKSCADVVKPGGSVFVTTFDKTNLSWFAGVIIAEYIFNFIPKGTHDWNNFIAPQEVQKLLEHSDCRTKVIHGMMYNFIINKWQWTSSTAICYALQAVKKNN